MAPLDTAAAAGLTVTPLAHALGAVIECVDINQPPAPDLVAATRKAWNQHHVIAFRGQTFQAAGLLRFAQAFGALDDHAATPFYRLEEYPQLLQITNRQIGGKPSETRNTGRNWHSDYSYTDHPAAASMLFCVECPPIGGDTMFANMVNAYETLSPPLRAFLDGLDVVYDVSLTAGINERDPAQTAEVRRLNPPIAHPAVRVHPDSGLRALYVSERA